MSSGVGQKEMGPPDYGCEMPLPLAHDSNNHAPPFSDSATGVGLHEDINLDQPKLRRYIDRSAKIARSFTKHSWCLLLAIQRYQWSMF
jgi:hypothetical protein